MLLGRAFYERPTLDVAREALGTTLVRLGPGGTRRAGRVVETEAYTQDDPSYHGWNAVDAQTGLVRMTGRTAAFFGPPGRAYVYRVYDHWMLNLVTEREGVCGSVLVRALDPVDGFDALFAARPSARRVHELCNGPGKLTAALGIDGAHHGLDLTTDEPGPAGALFLVDEGADPGEIATSSRVGLSRGIDLPWRFFVRGHPSVSPGVPSDVAAARRTRGGAARR